MAPTTPAATQAQLDALLNFMEGNRDFACGLLRSADGRMRSKRLWEDLCKSLNALGGCTKSIEQWQRVWADRKHLAKKAAGAARRSASTTGGGPSDAPNLSSVELRILAIMGDGFGEPQTEARVPAFPLLFRHRLFNSTMTTILSDYKITAALIDCIQETYGDNAHTNDLFNL
ncbi:hypothetical protein ABMA27_007791 [Loxostege sticticalis]|uniref:Regulatory protein zeste n=1 Tax=Loxostege sticticalis TaxID=481309 RepID=A0ABR3HCX3_LOXSC